MDTNNINFGELWNAKNAKQPATKNLLVKIKKLKRSNRIGLILINIILVLTSIFFLSIWFYYEPELITTKIGIVLTILAMFVFVMAHNRSFKLFKNAKKTQSNSEYLKDLLSIKTKQQFLQTTMLNLYFILLSLGIGLYIYEYTEQMTSFWGIFAYVITSFWILFNWFYLRPKQIKKQRAELNEIINKFENIQSQLKQE